MSRNICDTVCQHCEHEVDLVEEPRSITEDEAGPYFEEYRTMTVANAECPACKAKYLAWVHPPTKGIHAGHCYHDGLVYDLSYRSTFNDEPGEADLPEYEVEKAWVRVGMQPTGGDAQAPATP